MNIDLTAILIAVFTSGALSTAITYWLTRRKMFAEIGNLKAQETDTFAEAIEKFLRAQDTLQSRNAELYKENIALEKMLSDCDNTKREMANRLKERESQIVTLNKQLEGLQDTERQNQITQALVQQQQIVTLIAESYRKLIDERDKTIEALTKRTGPPRPAGGVPAGLTPVEES